MSDVIACDSYATMCKHKVPIYYILQLKMLQELKVYVGLYKPKVIVPFLWLYSYSFSTPHEVFAMALAYM